MGVVDASIGAVDVGQTLASGFARGYLEARRITAMTSSAPQLEPAPPTPDRAEAWLRALPASQRAQLTWLPKAIADAVQPLLTEPVSNDLVDEAAGRLAKAIFRDEVSAAFMHMETMPPEELIGRV